MNKIIIHYPGRPSVEIEDTKSFIFSGGEVHIELPDLRAAFAESVSIIARLENSDAIMELLMITDAIRRAVKRLPITVIIPYLPYARQDHISTPGESLSLKVFADLINSQQYHRVITYDAHSEVASALIDNLKVVSQATIIGYFAAPNSSMRGFFCESNLVSPDFGASKKIRALIPILSPKSIIQADKRRNPTTGEIVGIEIFKDDLGGEDVLIVDDIIDGGRTFIELAKALREKNCGRVSLFATHGIFSKGAGVLHDAGIDNIITTDTFRSKGKSQWSDCVTTINIVGNVL